MTGERAQDALDTPKGVVAILIHPDGHVMAHVSDFSRSGYGGYSLVEAQMQRAGRMLALETMHRMCNADLASVIDHYHAGEFVNELVRKHAYRKQIVRAGWTDAD